MDGMTRQAHRKRRTVVTYTASDVEQPTENLIPDRDSDREPGRPHQHAAFQPGGRLKRDTAQCPLVDMRLNLDDQRLELIPFDNQRLLKAGKCNPVKRDVDNRSTYGKHCSFWLL
jgi:hypothetical protein